MTSLLSLLTTQLLILSELSLSILMLTLAELIPKSMLLSLLTLSKSLHLSKVFLRAVHLDGPFLCLDFVINN